MEWVNKYIGLPFKPCGRTDKGLDCWGLVRMVYWDQVKILLPSYDGYYEDSNDHRTLGALVPQEAQDWVEVDPGEQRAFDVMVLRMRGMPMHTALVVDQKNMLHIHEGTNTVFENYTRPSWRDRILGFYRHKDLL